MFGKGARILPIAAAAVGQPSSLQADLGSSSAAGGSSGGAGCGGCLILELLL